MKIIAIHRSLGVSIEHNSPSALVLYFGKHTGFLPYIEHGKRANYNAVLRLIKDNMTADSTILFVTSCQPDCGDGRWKDITLDIHAELGPGGGSMQAVYICDNPTVSVNTIDFLCSPGTQPRYTDRLEDYVMV